MKNLWNRFALVLSVALYLILIIKIGSDFNSSGMVDFMVDFMALTLCGIQLALLSYVDFKN